MNLPQYAQAIDTAMRDYRNACEEASERMLKALALAKEEFFDDPERNMKAIPLDEEMARRRP